MSPNLLTQTPRGRWQTDEIVNKCSATELVRAVEANINAQLPLMYAHVSDVEVIDELDLLGRRIPTEPHREDRVSRRNA